MTFEAVVEAFFQANVLEGPAECFNLNLDCACCMLVPSDQGEEDDPVKFVRPFAEIGLKSGDIIQ